MKIEVLILCYFFIPFFITITLYFVTDFLKYKKTEYYNQTKNKYPIVIFNKGRTGEYKLYRKLKNLPGNNKFLFNCYIPKSNNTTSEIDVIMINKTGIFVFESKNYNGWIFGNENDKFWTQTMPTTNKNKQKNKFYSPILQNRNHIKYLNEYLNEQNITDINFFSFIVFGDNCEFKNLTNNNKNQIVTQKHKLNNIVKNTINSNEIKLSAEKINLIYNKLYPLTQITEDIKNQHISDIQSAIQPTNTEVNNACICPKCGSSLVLRTAKKGTSAGKQFYGCSSYPKCRYIKNIE